MTSKTSEPSTCGTNVVLTLPWSSKAKMSLRAIVASDPTSWTVVKSPTTTVVEPTVAIPRA